VDPPALFPPRPLGLARPPASIWGGLVAICIWSTLLPLDPPFGRCHATWPPGTLTRDFWRGFVTVIRRRNDDTKEQRREKT
jgi:hypothetical protein